MTREQALIAGGREHIMVGRDRYVTLFWETWFEPWMHPHTHSSELRPAKGFVVAVDDQQLRFATLEQADAKIKSLINAKEIAMAALGLRDVSR